MGKCILVDEQDNVLGLGDSNNLQLSDRIRITSVWITSPEGKILMAQRSIHKKHLPGVWGPAASGTVEPNETYEENAQKEVEEEIGIKLTSMRLGPKIMYPQRICQWYLATIPEDTPLQPRPREVDEARWFTKEELVQFYKTSPEKFTKSAAIYLPVLLQIA